MADQCWFHKDYHHPPKPTYLESDNGSPFASAELKEFVTKRKLNPKISSSHCSFENGLAETSNDVHLLHMPKYKVKLYRPLIKRNVCMDINHKILSIKFVVDRSSEFYVTYSPSCWLMIALQKKVLLTGVNILQKPQRKK
uniref:Integrase catalytic domain-containing protein n=2 Tax=Glossina palpalis gambiensis TaxID=67801 RepID=A0A1B0BDH7_9MUSC